MSESIRVMVAHRERLVAGAIGAYLSAQGDFEIVGETRDVVEALEIARTSRPHAAVVHLEMLGVDGLRLDHRLKDGYGVESVLLVSRDRAPSSDVRFACGAIVSADEPIDALAGALRRVVAFGLDSVATGDDQARGAGERKQRLTVLQQGVLRLLVEGRTSKQIADLLGISVGAVDHHRSRLMRRFRVGSATELARHAITRGIVSL